MIAIDLRIDDLTATQKQALQIAAPIIKAYLAKVLAVYRRCNEAQREELLAHNSILKAIVEGLGE